MSPTFVDALAAAHEARVAKRSKLVKAVLPPTVSAWLGAVLLDDAGWTPDMLLGGTSLIVCDDPDAVSAIKEAIKGVYDRLVSQIGRWEVEAEAEVGLALVDTTTAEELYDKAVTTGAPVVIVASDCEKVMPREACALATRRLDVPPVARSGFVEHLVEVVTGDAVQVSARSAARLSMLDVLRVVQLGSTGAEVKERIRALLSHRDKQDGIIERAKATPRVTTPEATVPSTAAAHDVVRRLGEMTGFGEASAWGINAARDLAEYAAGRLAWADVDRGLLLSGPPGGGKTTFARSFALECSEAAGREVPLVVTTYTDWSAAGGGVGDSMSKGLTKLFDTWRKQAAEAGPFVLFIDEVDSMGVRGEAAHNESWFSPIVNAWLAFLDGAVPRDGIVVVAATNHPNRVDPGLLRPGRLDRHVELPMPDLEALAGIVRAHLGPDAVLTDDEVAEAARAVRGRSPAEVGQLAREARRMARWCKRRVCASDLTDAVALQRGPVVESDDRMVAVHEAGHAVAALVLGVDRLEWVDQDRAVTRLTTGVHWDEAVVLGRLRMQLAARAAEEVVLGRVSTGCGMDLEDATGLAVAYHCAWGWGVAGLVSVGKDRAMADPRVMEAVRETLDWAYASALDLVRQHRAAVERVAEALQRRRYLDRDEVVALMAGPVAGPPRVRRSAPSMGPRIVRTVGRRADGTRCVKTGCPGVTSGGPKTDARNAK